MKFHLRMRVVLSVVCVRVVLFDVITNSTNQIELRMTMVLFDIIMVWANQILIASHPELLCNTCV